MKKSLIVLSLLVMGPVAHAESASCPNLSGKWEGSCKMNFQGEMAANLLSQPPFKTQQLSQLEVTQPEPGNPLECRLLTIGGESVLVGGINNQGFHFTLESGQLVALQTSTGSLWDEKNQGLIGKTAGLFQLGDRIFVPFGAGETLVRTGVDRLKRQVEVKGENFSASIQCDYQLR